jgi:hypothetical protein
MVYSIQQSNLHSTNQSTLESEVTPRYIKNVKVKLIEDLSLSTNPSTQVKRDIKINKTIN